MARRVNCVSQTVMDTVEQDVQSLLQVLLGMLAIIQNMADFDLSKCRLNTQQPDGIVGPIRKQLRNMRLLVGHVPLVRFRRS